MKRKTFHISGRFNFCICYHQGTRNKLTYDGMWHLDIPKTRQYDDGKLEVVARNSQGSASCIVELKVTPRTDDHRGVLKNSPKRESYPECIHPLFPSHPDRTGQAAPLWMIVTN
jgi:hypothetical protein